MNQYVNTEVQTNIEPKYNTMTNCYKVKTNRKTALALIEFAKYVEATEVSIKINTEWNYSREDELIIIIHAETDYVFTLERVAKILKTMEKIAQITEEE